MKMHVLELSVCLAFASAIVTSTAVHADLNGTAEADGARGQTTLGDMFRDAVHQVQRASDCNVLEDL